MRPSGSWQRRHVLVSLAGRAGCWPPPPPPVAALEPGLVPVACRGDNEDGQCGTGWQQLERDIVRPTPRDVAGSYSFVQLCAGVAHTCGLTVGGKAYCCEH